VADQVLFMDGGVIVERGAPAEVLTRPRTARCQQFLHRILDPL
jgi:cystine transport system ATP-binding protein